jgi:hypothetical protein
MKPFLYNEEQLFFSFSGLYQNKRQSIRVIDENGLSYVTISHNFPDSAAPEKGYFHAKYWSENNEIFMFLIRNKILEFHPKENDFHLSDRLLNIICPINVKISEEYLEQEEPIKTMFHNTGLSESGGTSLDSLPF